MTAFTDFITYKSDNTSSKISFDIENSDNLNNNMFKEIQFSKKK